MINNPNGYVPLMTDDNHDGIAIPVEIMDAGHHQKSPLGHDQIPMPEARSRACDARMEFKGALHAAMG